MAGRLNRTSRGEKRRESKRGSSGHEMGVAKMAELNRDLKLGEKGSPASGRERFRVGEEVRSAGRSYRY